MNLTPNCLEGHLLQTGNIRDEDGHQVDQRVYQETFFLEKKKKKDDPEKKLERNAKICKGEETPGSK